MFTLEVHYKGYFEQNTVLTYVGGSVKYFDDIDPTYMSRLELYELLKQLHLPVDMSIHFKSPGGEFVLINSHDIVMEMFGTFRDESHICLYIGDIVIVAPQIQDGKPKIKGAEHENMNAEDENGNGNKMLEVDDPMNNLPDNVNLGKEDPEKTYDSDFDFFLDGDTLRDDYGSNEEGDVHVGIVNNIDLGEYTAYAELISDEYKAFMEAKGQENVIENDNVSDTEILDLILDSSDDENIEPFTEFNEERDMINPEIVVGLIFSTVHVYRKALRMYSIRKDFELKFNKNEKYKVTAICNRLCGWRIHASYYRGTKAFQVKSITGTPHRCPWSFKNRSANSRWLADNFKKELCDDPKWHIMGFKKTVKRRFKLHSSKYQIYRAKNHALKAIQGGHKEQYYRLRDYCATIIDRNPGSAAFVQSEIVSLNANPIFKRMFIMFAAQKDGFIQGCRPVIGLDACHLKGTFGGHLMHAVSRDANNQMYPIAMAWVESECKDSWGWFLEILTVQIGLPSEMQWVFISDRQKGLVETFVELFPGVEHRFCVRHMYANFKLRFKDKTLRDILWAAARAYLPEQWSRKMRELQAANMDAYNWLIAIPPHLWARCMFNPRSKCDLLSNNISESFNQYISSTRDEPILTMFENIRRLIMCRYQEKREWIAKVKTSICPRIHDKLEEIRAKSVDYECIPAGNGIWEVTEYSQNFVVNLNGRTCSCREWDITGIPCVHACASIINSDKEAADFVHPYYSVDYYKRAYKHMIMPVPCQSQWIETREAPTECPKLRRMPGRPRKLRRKGPDEQRDKSMVTRRGITMHCRNCRQAGHNIKGCKEPRRLDENIATQTSTQAQGSNQVGDESIPTASQVIDMRGSNESGSSTKKMRTNAPGSATRGRGTNAPESSTRGSYRNNANESATREKSTSSGRSNATANVTRGSGRSNATASATRSRGRGGKGRIGMGRGRSGEFPGPYSGIGNWNGIGMSTGNHFMPADKVFRMIQHADGSTGGHTIQMWSKNFQSGPYPVQQTSASTDAISNIQFQRQMTRFGDVLFSSQASTSEVHVQQESRL